MLALRALLARRLQALRPRYEFALDRAMMSAAYGEEAAFRWGYRYRRHEAAVDWCKGFLEGWTIWPQRQASQGPQPNRKSTSRAHRSASR